MEITVEVTESDIRDGTRLNCFRCPIALAILRQASGHVQVSKAGVDYWPNPKLDTRLVGELPHDAKDFIQDFDFGATVSPFTFKLNLS